MNLKLEGGDQAQASDKGLISDGMLSQDTIITLTNIVFIVIVITEILTVNVTHFAIIAMKFIS